MKMKIAVSVLLIIGTAVVGKIMTPPPSDEITSAQEIAPEYAKWGRMAMQNVMEKYPNANVVDYLHIGREVGTENTVEKFKLWLRADDNHEFGVFVDITFNNQTEEVINIKYTETDR